MALSRCLALAFLAAALTGCAAFRPLPGDLKQSIADDAAAYNQAYADAVNAMLLQNILRARDRLPLYYTVMSGISDAPSRETDLGAALSGIPFGHGNARAPWAFGALSSGWSSKTQPSYSISPFADEKATKGIYNPIDARVFESFWNAGWPADVALNLLVDEIRSISPSASHTSSRQFPRGPGDPVDRRAVIAELSDEANSVRIVPIRAVPGGAPACRSVGDIPQKQGADAHFLEALAEARAMGLDYRIERDRRGRTIHRLYQCKDYQPDPGVIFLELRRGGKNLYFKAQLRSLDSAIYALGGWLRPGGAPDGPGAMPMTRPAGCAQGCADAPMFIVTDHPPKGVSDYAARVRYRGRMQYAGPPVDSRSASGDHAPMNGGDRSATVLKMLAQVLVLAQSPDSVRPPARLFVD